MCNLSRANRVDLYWIEKFFTVLQIRNGWNPSFRVVVDGNGSGEWLDESETQDGRTNKQKKRIELI